jgi:hypothetical protein
MPASVRAFPPVVVVRPEGSGKKSRPSARKYSSGEA